MFWFHCVSFRTKCIVFRNHWKSQSFRTRSCGENLFQVEAIHRACGGRWLCFLPSQRALKEAKRNEFKHFWLLSIRHLSICLPCDRKRRDTSAGWIHCSSCWIPAIHWFLLVIRNRLRVGSTPVSESPTLIVCVKSLRKHLWHRVTTYQPISTQHTAKKMSVQ